MARRGGLGKGLGALIPAGIPEGVGGLEEIPVAAIRPNPYQPREHFDEEELASLAESIREVGILQPVLVRETDDGYELIAGERRWRAARRVGLQNIPALVRDTDDASALEHALVENVHRSDLNVLEEAAAYQQLIEDFGLTHEEVAIRVGRSRTSVTNTLRLLQLPPTVQRLVRDKSLTMGHARALLGTPDRALQEQLARRIVAEGLSVRAIEDALREPTVITTDDATVATDDAGGSSAEAGNATRQLRPPGLLELESLLSDHLDTRVKVDMGTKRGKVTIEFSTLEDLERIYKGHRRVAVETCASVGVRLGGLVLDAPADPAGDRRADVGDRGDERAHRVDVVLADRLADHRGHAGLAQDREGPTARAVAVGRAEHRLELGLDRLGHPEPGLGSELTRREVVAATTGPVTGTQPDEEVRLVLVRSACDRRVVLTGEVGDGLGARTRKGPADDVAEGLELGSDRDEHPVVLEPARVAELLALAHRGDRSFGQRSHPVECAQGLGAEDAVDREPGVALELAQRRGALMPEDAVLAAGVEAERIEPVLEVGDVVTAQVRAALVEQPVAEREAALDDRRPGLRSADAVHPDAARLLERTDRGLGRRTELPASSSIGT